MNSKSLYVAVAVIFALEVAIILLLAPRVYLSPPPSHRVECTCLDCCGPYNVHLRDRPRSKPTGQTTGSLP